MELWKELLHDVTPQPQWEPEQLLELRAYQVLKKIQAILDDCSLDDISCFWNIEKIVRAFEEAGSTGGSRHDF